MSETKHLLAEDDVGIGHEDPSYQHQLNDNNNTNQEDNNDNNNNNSNSIQLKLVKEKSPSPNKIRHRNPQNPSPSPTKNHRMTTSTIMDISENGAGGSSAGSSVSSSIVQSTNIVGVSGSTRYGTLQSSSTGSGFKRNEQLVDNRYPRTYFTRKQFCIAAISMILFIAAVIVTLVFGLPRLEAKRSEYFAAKYYSSPIPESVHHQFTVLVSDNEYPHCSNVGLEILNHQQGSVMDAALASLFCVLMASPHLVGLDSGIRGLIQSNKTIYSFNSNERQFPLGNNLSLSMPMLPIAAEQLHQRFGKVPWSIILEPSIQLAQIGVPISESLAQKLRQHQTRLFDHFKSIQKLFIQQSSIRNCDTKTGTLLNNGELYKNPNLANTLKSLSINGSMAIFNKSSDKDSIFWVDEIINLLSLDNNQTTAIINSQKLRSMILNQKAKVLKIDQPMQFSLFDNGDGDILRLYTGNHGQDDDDDHSDEQAIILIQMLKILEKLFYSIDDTTATIMEMCKKDNSFSINNNDSQTSLKQAAIQFQYLLDTFQFGSATLAKLLATSDNIAGIQYSQQPVNESIILSESYIDEIVKLIHAKSNLEIKSSNYSNINYSLNLDEKTMDNLLKFENSKIKGNNVQIIVQNLQSGDTVALTTSKFNNLFQGDSKFLSKTGGFILDIFNNSDDHQTGISQWPVFLQNPKTKQIFATLGAIGGNGQLQTLFDLLQVMHKILFNCQPLKMSIDESRFNYRPPNNFIYEANFPQAYIHLLIRMFERNNLIPNTLVNDWHDSAVYAVMMMRTPIQNINDNNNNQTFLKTNQDSIQYEMELHSMIDYRLNGCISGQ